MADAGAMVALPAFVNKVVHAAKGHMPSGVQVYTWLAAHDLEPRDASSIGMVVNEAMANAAKHAFVGHNTGVFNVTGTLSGGMYSLICTGNGVGVTTDDGRGTGLGHKIMNAVAQQLGGTLEASVGDTGYLVRLVWPVAMQ